MALNQNQRQSRINLQRFSYTQNLEALKTNLFNCNSIEQRDYINNKGESKVYVQFNFPNGTKQLSIEPTIEVMGLLNDFMQNTGIFAPNQPEFSSVSLRKEETK